MAESAGPGTKVQFVEAAADGKPKTKNQPTQRYDRKEIQKRLDIENWMEQQLKDLYECQEDSYPELDIDDVLTIEESQREEKLKAYLKDAKKPIEGFVKELMEKALTIKV